MLKSNKYHELDAIRIIDLGLSKRFDPADKNPNKFKSVVGTPNFISPQVIKGMYDEKCDIWALGVIAYALFS